MSNVDDRLPLMSDDEKKVGAFRMPEQLLYTFTKADNSQESHGRSIPNPQGPRDRRVFRSEDLLGVIEHCTVCSRDSGRGSKLK